MIKILHKKCGGQYGWYLKDEISPTDMFSSYSVERMDGSHAIEGEEVNEICPVCNEEIHHPSDLIRIPKE